MADVFYPQCWVRFQLRFEDYIAVPPPLPQPTVRGDPVDNGGFVTLDQQVIPVACSVTLNSYRNADEATVTIPYGSLPIDPRVLRQATIQIFMGAFEDPATFAEGIGPIAGESQLTLIPETPDLQADLSAPVSNEIFRGFIDDWEISQDGDDSISISARDITALLIDAEMPIDGLADIPKATTIDEVIKAVVVGDETAQFVPPDAREKRASRIDARRDVRRLQSSLAYVIKKLAKLAAQAPTTGITAEVARLTAKQAQLTTFLAGAAAVAAAGDAVPIIAKRYGLPGMRGLAVVNLTGGQLPTLESLKGATWFDSKGNAKKARGGGSGDRISYWDFVTDLCVGVGLICYMRTPVEIPGGSLGALPPAELVIDLPKTYYKEQAEEIRRFAYGLNVDSLNIQRNYNGRNTPVGVAVSAIEAKTGQPISVRFPEIDTTTKAAANPLGTGDRAEYQTIALKDRIPGDNAQAVLDRIAESIYEQIGRGEMVVRVETSTLNAFPSNAGTGIVDMFAMRAGDPIEVEIVPSIPDAIENTFVTQAGQFWKLSTPERVEKLINAYQFNPIVAAQLALAMESDLLQKVFYVREIGIDFDFNSGFKFSIESINFLDARYALVRQSVDFLPDALRLVEGFLPTFEDD